MKRFKLIYILLFATLILGCNKTTFETPPVEPPIDSTVESYVVPIVFHVLYDDPSDINQYIKRGRINEIVSEANRFFKDNNVNVTVRLAEKTPAGKLMDEAGVNRIKVDDSRMDAEIFMSTNSVENTNMLWDTEEYVNVFTYEFTSENLAGISHLPYTSDLHKIEGLPIVNQVVDHSNLGYPHSISLNNEFIYLQGNSTTYVPGSASVTFIHELSHYLGVLHVFSEREVYDENGDYLYSDMDVCEDTDYCTDTETYNKVKYDEWVGNYFIDKTSKEEAPLLSDLVKRQNCSGLQFIATNVMDYDYSYMSKLTTQQVARMHHVIDYSPLMPIQNSNKRRRAVEKTEGVIDLPFVVIK